MTTPPPLRIEPPARTSRAPFSAHIPGSKSITNRALVLAAMRTGTTAIAAALHADDTLALARALAFFSGLAVETTPDGFRTTRTAVRLRAPAAALDLGGSGTGARFLLAFATAADGATVVTGDDRLRQRPMRDLLDALAAIGIRCECLGEPGCLPVRVHGGAPSSRSWNIATGTSSQFTSALLLLASQWPGPPIELALAGERVSEPYVDLTLAMLRDCGIAAERRGDRIVVTPAMPAAACIEVEPDASSASYFLAAAAMTGTTVAVRGLGTASHQGDVGFARVLAAMGCTVDLQPHEVRVTGAPLRGIEVDLAAMPDVALTLCAVATRARGRTRITGIGPLRGKESDRIAAAAEELTRLGQRVEQGRDWLAIEPAPLRPATVRTHGDHRVAMAFALLGLCAPGIAIEHPECAAKSFPGFWQELERWRHHHEDARA